MSAKTCLQCGADLPTPAGVCPRCSTTPPPPSATLSLPVDPPAPSLSRSTPHLSGGGTNPQPHSPTPGELEWPTRIGRFEVRRWVGEGTFAEVYLAYDPQLDREVALKVAKPGTLGTPRRVRRFLREARAAGNLRHPHIVPLHETGEDNGRHFLVSAFIHGQTLAAALDAARTGGGLPLADAARFARRLAEALAYAHAEGVIHRDVKPENVMVDDKGEPLLMDFGLAARAEEAGEQMTMVGVAVGTPAYMAPEQARGEVDAIGPACDQYALGCTLFELVTGRTPFAGPPQVQLLLHQSQAPPAPRQLRRQVPRDLETIALKCLEKDPAKRYPDCQAVADDLRRWLDGEPISARRPALPERLIRWTRRNPGAAAGVAAVVLVVAGALVAWDQVRTQREADRVEAERRLGQEQLAAETKRLNDLQAAEAARLADLQRADATAKQKERKTRAESLVQALAVADSASVPRLIDDLTDYRELAGPKLREMAAGPVTTKPGLHARLALLADEPARAAELVAYLPACRPEELLPVRDVLKPHAAAVAAGLWAVLTAETAEPGKRVRAACALAGVAPGEARWKTVAPTVVGHVIRENPLEALVWAQALEPVRGDLIPALLTRYAEAGGRLRAGKLGESDLVAEASAFDLAASLLARYTADRPADLAEFAMTVDARHFRRIADAIRAHRPVVVPVLKAELSRSLLADWGNAFPKAAWPQVTSVAGKAVAAAGGQVHDRFAFAQAVPLGEFHALAEALSPAGYRPVRARPYVTPAGVMVAAVWRRDGVRWKLLLGADEKTVRARAEEFRRDGFQPMDVAAWPHPVEGGRAGGALAAVGGGVAGLGLRPAPPLVYTVVFEAAAGGKPVFLLSLGIPAERHQRDFAQNVAKRLAPRTVHRVADPNGEVWTSGVWVIQTHKFWQSAGRSPDFFVTPEPGFVLFDMSVFGEKGNTKYATVWWPAPFDQACLTLQSPANHLAWASELAQGGYVMRTIAAFDGHVSSVWHRPLGPDAARDNLAKRQANAAAVLLTLGETEAVWPLFKHSPDPSTRSYLIERAAGFGVGPVALIGRFRAETDVSAKRALVIALGDFPAAPGWAGDREAFAGELLGLYRTHPDAGLHGAIDWLLRQRWGKEKELAEIDAGLSAAARGRIALRAVPMVAPAPAVAGVADALARPLWPAPAAGPGRGWFVNGQGQTFAAVREPAQFMAVDSRADNVAVYRDGIGRSFAIGTKEVTNAEFSRFLQDRAWSRAFSPADRGPAVALTWYTAAKYCNWLSGREGIPESQWCYEPNDAGGYAAGMRVKPGHLSLAGYRLPTEPEWEYACRAGSRVGRYYGRSEELLSRYGWYLKNAGNVAAAAGRLRPNDTGLFDTLGNAWEWCDVNTNNKYVISEQNNIYMRGGSFYDISNELLCTNNNAYLPGVNYNTFGFRLARTLTD